MADFVVERWDLGPFPGDQAPPHIHHASDEAFGVISGRLEVLVGDERKVLEPGDLQVVAAGTVHTFATVGDEPVRMYCVMTSEVDALIKALHAASTDEERAAAWADHRSSLA
jgi:quercetin dioxygenase-like cupin family protein